MSALPMKHDRDAGPLLIRLATGVIFLSEGVQKFLFAEALGAGRFARIGIPSPEVLGPFVAVVEIVCGALLLLGLRTGSAAIPLIVDIGVALAVTKVPILLGHGYWRFASPPPSQHGFWAFMHESRVDFAMLLGLLFLSTRRGRCPPQ